MSQTSYPSDSEVNPQQEPRRSTTEYMTHIRAKVPATTTQQHDLVKLQDLIRKIFLKHVGTRVELVSEALEAYVKICVRANISGPQESPILRQCSPSLFSESALTLSSSSWAMPKALLGVRVRDPLQKYQDQFH